MPIPRIPLRMNLLLLLLAMRLWLVELVAVPLAMAWLHPAYGLLLLAALLLIPLRWQLLHEAAHGRLLPTRRYNRLAGRLLAISLGLPLMSGARRISCITVTAVLRSAGWRCMSQAWSLLAAASCCCACACVAGPICWPGRAACCCVTRLPPAGTGWPAGSVVATFVSPHAGQRQLQLARLDAVLACLLPGLSLLVYGQHDWMLWLALLAARGADFTDRPCLLCRTAAGLCAAGGQSGLPRWLGLCLLNSHLRGVHQRWPQLAGRRCHSSLRQQAYPGMGFCPAAVCRTMAALPVIPLRKAGMGIMPADFHYPG
jgi:hypothetical protein